MAFKDCAHDGLIKPFFLVINDCFCFDTFTVIYLSASPVLAPNKSRVVSFVVKFNVDLPANDVTSDPL